MLDAGKRLEGELLNLFRTVSSFAPAIRLQRFALLRACALWLISGGIIALAQSTAAPGVWTQQPGSESPGARYYALMANDGSGHIVLFGGSSHSHILNDTWLWDGKMWKQQSPNHHPPARSNGAMASDAAGHIVLFSGASSGGELQDTWTWDGRDWTLQSPATSPPGRESAAMSNDGAGNVILFGGTDGAGGALNDTWVWNATTRNWTQQLAPNSPTGRYSASLADDGAHHVVLFGGTNQNSRTLNETWTWEGGNWKQQFLANSPGARESASMANDGTGRVVLFGGYPGFGATDLNDTWIWDGSSWTQERPANSPQARVMAALAIQEPGRLILFGGMGEAAFVDTWTYQHSAGKAASVK